MIFYSQSTGKFTAWQENDFIGVGYSGRGAGLNNPALEGALCTGPIPRGVYTLGAVLETGPGRTGEYVIQLIPDDATRATILALGRDPDSFFCHGDNIEQNHTASEGCIVAPRAVREALVQIGGQLTVTS